jgi:hypothetical protein
MAGPRAPQPQVVGLAMHCSAGRLDTGPLTASKRIASKAPTGQRANCGMQSRTFRTSASAARVGRTAGCRTGSSLGVLAVLSRARSCLFKVSYACLARLPGCPWSVLGEC